MAIPVPLPAGGGRMPPDFRKPGQRGPAEIVYLRPRAPLAPQPHLRGTRAIIYKPAPSVMQGRRAARHWVLEFEPVRPPVKDFLMGWTGGGDADAMVRLRFPDRASAERFAKVQCLDYTVVEPPPEPALKPRAYADNFTVPPPELLGELSW